jgi:outer membrane protein TolC
MIPQFTSQQWQAIHRIAVLLGEDIEPVAKQLIEVKPIPVPPDTVPVGVPAELLRRRPDIRMAERQLAAATARTGVAEADLYPHLKIGGQFGLTADRGSTFFQRDSIGYGIGPSVSWPIFDGGRVRGMIKVRSAQQEQAMIAYEATVRRGIAEVRDALVQFTQEHRRRQSLVEAEKANASSVSMAQQLYAKGLSDFLAVLDAPAGPAADAGCAGPE